MWCGVEDEDEDIGDEDEDVGDVGDDWGYTRGVPLGGRRLESEREQRRKGKGVLVVHIVFFKLLA